MAKYVYKARDGAGDLLQGIIEADDLLQAAGKLQQLGYFIITLKEGRHFSTLNRRQVNLKNLALMCQQLVSLLKAGVPLLSGMQIIYQMQKDTVIKSLLHNLMNEIKLGSSFSQACALHRSHIPPLMVNMIYAGEKGGFLENTLERLATYFEKEAEMKDKILTAISYSIIVLAASIVFVFFLFSIIVPMYLEVYQDMGIKMSSKMKIFLRFGLFLTGNWFWILLIIALICSLLILIGRTPQGRRLKDKFIFEIPILGNLFQRILISRLCKELAYLLGSGLNVSHVLKILHTTNCNTYLQEEIAKAHENLKLGISLSASFQQSSLIPEMVAEMIRVGEEAGNLEELLIKTGEFFEQEIQHLITRLPKLIEPFILVVVGVIVGALILGFFLPMLNTMYQLDI